MDKRSWSARGYTLVEMMVSISIAAILLAIAVPSYHGSRLNSQLRAASNDLIGSINLARSEAIKRGGTVTLCASSDGETCGGTWRQGWVIRAGADVIHTAGAVPDGFRITESAGNVTVLFQSTGVDTTAATFTVCRRSPTPGAHERVISMDATGRAFVRRTSTGSCS